MNTLELLVSVIGPAVVLAVGATVAVLFKVNAKLAVLCAISKRTEDDVKAHSKKFDKVTKRLRELEKSIGRPAVEES